VTASSLLAQTAIVGIGQTEFSRDSGRSELQLACEASRAAIEDAGLNPADIDGMVTFDCDPNDELAIIRSLGISGLRWVSRTFGAGAGAGACVHHAAAAVASGAARNVLVFRAFNERSGRRFGQPASQVASPGLNWTLPYGLDTPAKISGLWYQPYMARYGVTNADFGLYSVAARKYAATNPNARFYRRPITLEDHQASRWIVEPIVRLLDCCLESDGGVALIVTSADRARDTPKPVRIEAADTSHLFGGDILFDYYRRDAGAGYPEAESLARNLFRAAGVTNDDIDVCMIYENFTPVVFLQLEACGFCGAGEAKDFIAEGNIDIDGKLPVNTNGGHVGEAYIHGVNLVLEAVRQVRGTAFNQVVNVEHAMMTCGRSGIILGHL
jgi:acetyl-CoA acetyltransferase